MIRREIVPHVTRVVPGPNGFTLELVGSPALHARLVQLVELERRCCERVTWEIEGDSGATTLRLVVEGIDAGHLDRLGLSPLVR